MPVVEALRRRGHDVLTVFEDGNANQRIGDEAVLAFATADYRALVTINRRDFIRLHHRQPVHQGIIVCTEDSDIDGQAQRIDDAILSVDSLAGVLLRVNRPA
jgi:hypothetical protein